MVFLSVVLSQRKTVRRDRRAGDFSRKVLSSVILVSPSCSLYQTFLIEKFHDGSEIDQGWIRN